MKALWELSLSYSSQHGYAQEIKFLHKHKNLDNPRETETMNFSFADIVQEFMFQQIINFFESWIHLQCRNLVLNSFSTICILNS